MNCSAQPATVDFDSPYLLGSVSADKFFWGVE